MNWETIKNIYIQVLICNNKIEYLGDDKYKLTSFYSTGEKHWEREFKNEQLHGKYINWYRGGSKYLEQEYQNGRYIKTLLRKVNQNEQNSKSSI